MKQDPEEASHLQRGVSLVSLEGDRVNCQNNIPDYFKHMQRVFNECQVVPAFSISAFSVDRNLPGELSEVCFCRSRHCCCCCCCVDLQSLCLNLLQEGPTSLPLQGLAYIKRVSERIVSFITPSALLPALQALSSYYFIRDFLNFVIIF